MPIGLIDDAVFKQHHPGFDHPESSARLDAIREGLRDADLLERTIRLGIRPATAEQLALVHEPAYVALVRLACEEGFGYIGDQDTQICHDSYDAAIYAAGGALAAVDAVMADRVQRVFAALRPPGHHAERDRAGGFCLFNNAALAAQYAITRYDLERIAIVDFDVHHGNGTQAIFYDRADVLYISLHEHPLSMKYPGTGFANETGSGPGEGFTMNLFIPNGGDESDYRRALDDHALPRLDDFAPQLLVLSAGFDAQRTESIAHVNLPPDAFEWMTRDLCAVADRHASGRVVSVLEGGYELGPLGRCAAAHVRGLLDPTRSAEPLHRDKM